MSLADSKAFSGFAADDMDAVRKFYGETLGLKTSDQDDLLVLNLAGDRNMISTRSRTSSRRRTRSSTSPSTTSARRSTSSPRAG